MKVRRSILYNNSSFKNIWIYADDSFDFHPVGYKPSPLGGKVFSICPLKDDGFSGTLSFTNGRGGW
jgi:hypothetical protein